MSLSAEYAPSSNPAVVEQVSLYEATDGASGGSFFGTPCVLLTTVGRQTGKLRKTPVMRVEHGGIYAVVASKRGAPVNPAWYVNLVHDPRADLQDGATKVAVTARELRGDERALWWGRAIAVWPEYEDYAAKAGDHRVIPVLLLEPRGD